MKQGKTLVQLATELQNIQETAKDFVVPTEKLEAKVNDASKIELAFQNPQNEEIAVQTNTHSSGQVATYTDIPLQYFRRLEAQNPELLAKNINNGLALQHKTEKRGNAQHRMLRTMNQNDTPTLRALVSDKYRRLDSFDLLNEVLPTLQDAGLQVVSSEITEQRMYLKCLSPKLMTEIKKDDVVQYGLVISNSDVGSGSLRIEPLVHRLVCLNGMIANTAMKKYHVGKSQIDNDMYELLTADTRDVTDTAFWMQVNDLIKASLDSGRFESEVDRLRVAADMQIKSVDPLRVVELAMKATGVTGEKHKKNIVAALASGNEGAGYTQYGLINSFTRAAQNEEISYQDSIDLERAGGQILELKPNQWQTIAAVGA